MNPLNKSMSGRLPWLVSAAATALAAAALRRWQLGSAFEEETGLAIPGAQASVILVCVLMLIASLLIFFLRRGVREE